MGTGATATGACVGGGLLLGSDVAMTGVRKATRDESIGVCGGGVGAVGAARGVSAAMSSWWNADGVCSGNPETEPAGV